MREQKPVSDSSFQTAGHGPSPGINLGNDIQHGEKENKGKENQSTKKEKKIRVYISLIMFKLTSVVQKGDCVSPWGGEIGIFLVDFTFIEQGSANLQVLLLYHRHSHG